LTFGPEGVGTTERNMCNRVSTPIACNDKVQYSPKVQITCRYKFRDTFPTRGVKCCSVHSQKCIAHFRTIAHFRSRRNFLSMEKSMLRRNC
jgi:hypothetical protein